MKLKRRESDKFQLDQEVLKIARICLGVFSAFIAFGIFAPTQEQGLYDPKWIRIVHSSVTFAFFLFSYFSFLIRRYIQSITLVFFYTMSTHSLALLYWNSLFVGYLIGMVMVISCIGVSFVNRRWLVNYLVSVSSAGILVGIYTVDPQVDLSLYITSIITPAIVSYLTLNVRLGSVAKLRDSEFQLKLFHDRVSRDLELAQEIQNNLVTTVWPKIAGIKFTSFFRSFEKVGGDAISYKLRSDGSIAIFFADVSGHGIASAMVSAMAVLAFNIHAVEEEPATCLRAMHEDLRNLVTTNHISAVVVYYFPETKKISYSYAGHPPLLYLKTDGKFQFLEGSGRLIVSMLEPKLRNYSRILEEEDRLLLYSDGMIEVFDEEGRIFGEENLVSSIKNHFDKKGETLLNAVFEDVMAYSKEAASDDMSMLLLELQ
ncbi:PP2C family protein-serine/threonine phosphatase [Leptospira ilyithenensis]|uniref:Serine/threonine-protein phosphatase n=1 Tax=Leptospira ilyithenensis TaxID=2484901 RepID=A0A4R9LJ04_9LEPT|nr:PP2C family protein-serine/threonine phosphatase [Leptospira ilyithenensis]TGN06847.1 serine/threonine-protein phosphatase [Leptospira ilyithenensis]